MRDLRIFRIFEGSNEILRLMIALQSMQVLGKILKENKGMAVKAKVSETLGMSLSGNASGNLASKTDSSLSSQAKAVEGLFIFSYQTFLLFKSLFRCHH